MMLPINTEKAEITLEINLVERMRFRLSHHMKYHKQFTHIKVLFKLIEKHLNELASIERGCISSLQNVNIDLYLEANTRIKNHIIRKRLQVKQFIYDIMFEPYINLAITCFTKIITNLNRIEDKITDLQRNIKEYKSQQSVLIL